MLFRHETIRTFFNIFQLSDIEHDFLVDGTGLNTNWYNLSFSSEAKEVNIICSFLTLSSVDDDSMKCQAKRQLELNPPTTQRLEIILKQ